MYNRLMGLGARIILTLLLIGSMLVAYVPGFAAEGASKDTAQIIVAVYLSAMLAVAILEGSRKQ